jgi:hypothetical protein
MRNGKVNKHHKVEYMGALRNNVLLYPLSALGFYFFFFWRWGYVVAGSHPGKQSAPKPCRRLPSFCNYYNLRAFPGDIRKTKPILLRHTVEPDGCFSAARPHSGADPVPIRPEGDHGAGSVDRVVHRPWIGSIDRGTGFHLGGEMERPERTAILQPASSHYQGPPGDACVRRSNFAAAGGHPAGKAERVDDPKQVREEVEAGGGGGHRVGVRVMALFSFDKNQTISMTNNAGTSRHVFVFIFMFLMTNAAS